MLRTDLRQGATTIQHITDNVAKELHGYNWNFFSHIIMGLGIEFILKCCNLVEV